MIDKHLLKLRRRDLISPEEEVAIRAGVSSIIKAKADTVIARHGATLDVSTILLSGIAARQIEMLDGRRQMTELHVAGDFLDLHSFTLKHLDHDLVALSDCTLALVPHAHLQEITEKYPHLTRVYWFNTNLDACIHRQWVVSLARRSALARMAHLFCELYIRLDIVGLVRGGTYDLPLTQDELAETLGLTSVHVNRTLQELRRTGYVNFDRKVVSVCDFAALKEVGEFDDAYLYLDRLPEFR